jgi:hypothetical protein
MCIQVGTASAARPKAYHVPHLILLQNSASIMLAKYILYKLKDIFGNAITPVVSNRGKIRK